MKLWISSETQSDVFDLFRVASIKVEDCINDVISEKNYDLDLDGWDCIAILRDDDDNFEEVIKYSSKKKDMDFRLIIDYKDFKTGTDIDRERLIFGMLLRSLELLEDKGVAGDGIQKLKVDVKGLASANGWI